MKQFFLNLIDSNNPQSGKTFAGLVVLFTTICLAISATAANHGVCPDGIFNSLLLFGAAAFGLQLGESLFNKKTTVDPEPVVPPENNANIEADKPTNVENTGT